MQFIENEFFFSLVLDNVTLLQNRASGAYSVDVKFCNEFVTGSATAPLHTFDICHSVTPDEEKHPFPTLTALNPAVNLSFESLTEYKAACEFLCITPSDQVIDRVLLESFGA